MLGFRAFQLSTLSLHGSIFLPYLCSKGKACSVPHEPLAIPDGDGSSVPRKSLESAGQRFSEEGKRSCCSQWN